MTEFLKLYHIVSSLNELKESPYKSDGCNQIAQFCKLCLDYISDSGNQLAQICKLFEG